MRPVSETACVPATCLVLNFNTFFSALFYGGILFLPNSQHKLKTAFCEIFSAVVATREGKAEMSCSAARFLSEAIEALLSLCCKLNVIHRRRSFLWLLLMYSRKIDLMSQLRIPRASTKAANDERFIFNTMGERLSAD